MDCLIDPHCRYRQAFIWGDKTVNYVAEIARGTYRSNTGVKCAALGVGAGQAEIVRCHTSGQLGNDQGVDWSVCQMPHTQPGQ